MWKEYQRKLSWYCIHLNWFHLCSFYTGTVLWRHVQIRLSLTWSESQASVCIRQSVSRIRQRDNHGFGQELIHRRSNGNQWTSIEWFLADKFLKHWKDDVCFYCLLSKNQPLWQIHLCHLWLGRLWDRCGVRLEPGARTRPRKGRHLMPRESEYVRKLL